MAYIFEEPSPEADEAAASRRKNDLQTVMTTSQGRRFVWSLIVAGRLYEPGIMTEYAMGQRDFALALRAEIQGALPDEWRAMERENG